MTKELPKELSPGDKKKVLVVTFSIVIGLLIVIGLSNSQAGTVDSQAAPAYQRQADGGTFASPQELLQTLDDLGAPCTDPAYGDADIASVECWGGYDTVRFVTLKPGQSFWQGLLMVMRPPAFRLQGQNWYMVADKDPDYGRQVKELIGGDTFIR
ncbi:hypothetical protein [Sphaerisporangium perillae]|uniref:hypothetical protein n=1 Tax=Sphaerisporangium perillae TaxID=2935860 RepID=UPI00200EEB40|nr:hypothetical protein [Sphaerisporangium perillae]